MKKLLPLSASLFLLIATLLTFTGSSAKAQVSHQSYHSYQSLKKAPLNSACSLICHRYITWQGTNHGAETDATVDEPSTSGLTNYKKELAEGALDNSYIDVGEVWGIDDACNSNSWQFFFEARNADNNTLYTQCFPIPAADVNKSAHYGISYYASGGGGAFIWLYGGSGTSFCTPCSIADSDFAEPWDDAIGLSVSMQRSSFTGHYVWGGVWDFNAVFINGSYLLQNRPSPTNCVASNGCPQGTVPPQMFWHTYPSQQGGGELYSCVYDSTVNTCTLGS